MFPANRYLGVSLRGSSGQVQASTDNTLVDCHPLDGATERRCLDFGCSWAPAKETNRTAEQYNSFLFQDKATTNELPPGSNVQRPWCIFPPSYRGYKLTQEDGNTWRLARARPSSVPDDIEELKLHFETFGGDGSILRLRIYDAKNERFEPKVPALPVLGEPTQGSESQYNVSIDALGKLIVSRRSTGTELFATDLSKLIFANKFIQLNSKLSSSYVYGLGEHFDSFLKKADSFKTYSFFNTDKLPLPGGRRSYGSFPFYVNIEPDLKHAHGVYLRNSDAMDIVLQSDQSITFRPIGGILDFLILSGPTATDVVTQYQHLVGLPALPPRWALGFHLCRYGYKTLNKTRLVWKRNRDAGIPFDVMWNDIDQMDRHNDFTYDKVNYKGLPQFVDELHRVGMHYMLLFDPGISQEKGYRPYDLGLKMGVFVRNASGQVLVGKVWNDSGRTVFPDFSLPASNRYWTTLFQEFHREVAFDGAWIDMNDISNFVTGSLDGCPRDNPLEQTPYKPGGYDLQTNTLCLSAVHDGGKEYDLHNLYSFYEAVATHRALNETRREKRPLIISRSTSPGQGHYGGHWSGDVLSNWDYLAWSIPSLIEHSMYGFTMMGSDICGFSGDTTADLCARWSTLGAFYTFSRNHNDDRSIDQDPVALGPIVAAANKNALRKKYALLPYLYTLVHRAHLYGEPVIRSVPFEFYQTDGEEALKVETQFLWGQALMVSPIVKRTNVRESFLPRGRWYETNIKPDKNGQVGLVPKLINAEKALMHTTTHVDLDDIVLFYRGGHVIPYYDRVEQTTTATAKDQPISLQVALCSMGEANGELYLDDGDNIYGKVNHLLMASGGDSLVVSLDRDEYQPETKIGKVRVLGLGHQITEVKANGNAVKFVQTEHVLNFDLESINVTINRPLMVNWS